MGVVPGASFENMNCAHFAQVLLRVETFFMHFRIVTQQKSIIFLWRSNALETQQEVTCI